jgi:long-chain acyl-CoA synthetase
MAAHVKNNLIHHFLERSACQFPDKCAMVHGENRVSYEDLNRSANRLAHLLIEQGIAPGDRVVLLLENCQEYLIGYYGTFKSGGVTVPVNPDLKPDKLSSILTEISPRFIISSAKSEKTLHSVDFSAHTIRTLIMARPRRKWLDTSVQIIPFDEISSSDENLNPNLAIDETCLASIIFTSGSIGKPKGVMLSHKNIVSNTHSIINFLKLTSSDIQMVVLPFFYVMGKSLLNTHIAVGGTVIINNSFAYPASVVKQMVEEKVTGFSGVPSTYAYLLHRSPLRSARDSLGSLRYCSQAGGHMVRHIKEELIKVLPKHTKLFVMYGATEAAARLTYVEPDRIHQKMESIGIPIPDVTMKVLDELGKEVPKGEIGELVANGPNIMMGYWQDPESTVKVIDHNGYHTGDIGYQDEDDYFYVLGRRDYQLKVGGHRINPQEIEDALIATDLVLECVVLGMEDLLAGHRLVSAVVPIDAGTTDRDILYRCSKLLPRHKLPSEVFFLRTLPKNSSGKIDREACKELLHV